MAIGASWRRRSSRCHRGAPAAPRRFSICHNATIAATDHLWPCEEPHTASNLDLTLVTMLSNLSDPISVRSDVGTAFAQGAISAAAGRNGPFAREIYLWISL